MSNVNKGYIIRLRQSRTFRGIVVCILLNFLFEVVRPTAALALTEGPSQPETQSFEPIGTTQMVDLFTGDFNYNIPLFNLPGPNGGYPVNLAYHAGTAMDDEASWVGLGWNINVGSLNRQMRGLPDEFQSKLEGGDPDIADPEYDYVEVKSDIKQNWTLGLRGSAFLEIIGADLSKVADLGLNASIYYNNYNGIGTSFGMNIGKHDSPFSVGLSLDSENGLGVSASASLSKQVDAKTKAKHKFTVSFDGSLSVDYSLSSERRDIYKCPHRAPTYSDYKTTGAYGSSVSFARNNFTPATQHRMNTYSLDLGVKGGIEGAAVFVYGSVGIFFNTQDMNDDDIKGRKRPVVGYAEVGDLATLDPASFTHDFTRYNDGQITKSSMFLPVSVYNYDVYTSTGQGLSGYFRPHRADIGRVHDPKNVNNSYGASVNLEVGAGGLANFGLDGGLSFGYASQGPWDEHNDLHFDFDNPNTEGKKENLYYQAHGEMTILSDDEMVHINGFELPIVKLAPKQGDGLGGKRRISSTIAPNLNYSAFREESERAVRNTLIHNLKNHEVKKLGEFDVKYFANSTQVTSGVQPAQSMNSERTLRNEVNIGNHPAGYKVLNEEGNYYVYALPAYNNIEVENVFTVPDPNNPQEKDVVSYTTDADGEADYKVNNTHKFINKTKKSPYAHSYLLSSVQGADYVDVKNDGPTDDDLGYWVKFNYVKYADDYKWRAPYTDAQYHQGDIFTKKDDKASYQYGEKEVWYLGQIETKSHIAVYQMSVRQDMKEASGEHATSGTMGTKSGMKVDAIKIYEKKAFYADPANAVALQEVHFNYTYELCKQSPNSSGTNQAKLTLKDVWFTSNGSTRGELSKYSFEYGTGGQDDNPNYKRNTYDSWGVHKPLGTNYEHHSRFPYTNQFNQDWGLGIWEPNYGTDEVNTATKELTKNQQDKFASAWCLKKINLPSGGQINIQYESDDYGYVQHKTANQMFKIRKLGDLTSPEEIYATGSSGGDFYNTGTTNDEQRRRIYFKLEEPIPIGNPSAAALQVYNSYVAPIILDEDDQRNLYFKAKMRLNNNVGANAIWDYVSGYLPLEEFNATTETYGASMIVGGFYTEGFVTVKASKKKDGGYFDQYHPMALAGWTYLQTNAPEVLNDPGGLANSSSFGNANDLLNVLPNLMSIVPATAANFGLIRSYCKSQSYARYIDSDFSCIRLASPDKIKYGGGHRVKSIAITDNWSADPGVNPKTYGQAYDYTLEENGKIISSGVAQYEPQAGGDENPLKYPYHYYDKQTTFTNNSLFAEAPVNESLFPGPSVGYRRVTVRSLNTDGQIKNEAISGTGQGRIGGVTVHEFYTSKEFPTLVEYSLLAEENDTKDVFNVTIPIPLIGSVKRNLYHGTQAYKIELNDMHGKPKSVKTFEVNNYVVNPKSITESIYEYQAQPLFYQGENVFKLDNSVNVIKNDDTHTFDPTQKKQMGVEYDLFTDQREAKTYNLSTGVEVNIDMPPSPIPLPSVWLSSSYQESLFRTYVTNKVIHRSGILKRTVSRDLQTVNETEILAYDEKSGQPLLTKIKNEFGDDFYSYNIPAYYHYDQMSHAYENINYSFSTWISQPQHGHDGRTFEFVPTSEQIATLVRGDELLVGTAFDVLDQANSPLNQGKKAYFIGLKRDNSSVVKALIHFVENIDISPSSAGYWDVDFIMSFKIIRSGRRNHYSTMAANYLTKGQIDNLTVQPENADYGGLLYTKVIPSNVLSATANLFKGDWSLNDETNSAVLSDYDIAISTPGQELAQGFHRVINPFITGTSGIWRPFKSYTYVGKRVTNGNMNDNTAVENPELYNDGVFENSVPMFSWDVGDMEEYVSNWEWVNEVTRFSKDAYEVENRNRLDIRSSALYGYDNSLTIAVGGNAGYYELGFEDFENSNIIDWGDGQRTAQKHLNFNSISGEENAVISEKVNIDFAVSSNSGSMLDIKIVNPSEYVKYFFQNSVDDQINVIHSTFGIDLEHRNGSNAKNESYFINGSLSSFTISTDLLGNEVLYGHVAPHYNCTLEDDSRILPSGEFFGSITMYEKRPLVQNNYLASTMSSLSGKAHTGKRSLRISETVTLDQPMINSIKDKKYIASFWISRNDTKVRTYKPLSGNIIVPGTFIAGVFTQLPVSQYKVSYGKIVEGWQKVDMEYILTGVGEIIAFRFEPFSNTLYIDDFRVSPKTGGITTYVYDPVKFWLRASLNVDNYATLFYYDEEGNLTLKKQETEKGIFTITESRGHVTEQ